MIFLAAIVLILIDVGIKACVLSRLSEGESLAVIENILHLTLVKNTGIAFGLFPDQKIISFIVPAIIIVLVMIFHKQLHEGKGPRKYCLVMILAGAIGNLIDRVRYGAVIDYIDFRIWPVFNFADTLICTGFGALILCILFCSISDR